MSDANHRQQKILHEHLLRILDTDTVLFLNFLGRSYTYDLR